MPAAGLTFAVAGCPVQEHADPPHLFGLRAGVDQQINSRRLTGRRFSQTRLSYHTADERTALSGTLPLDSLLWVILRLSLKHPYVSFHQQRTLSSSESCHFET
jgi:hypothetical protein